MSTIAFDQFALTRIADFARSLSRLHQASRRQAVDDDAIDCEFNAVCMSVWGYTTDDFRDVSMCDLLIAFTEPPRSNHSRGGRHVEFERQNRRHHRHRHRGEDDAGLTTRTGDAEHERQAE